MRDSKPKAAWPLQQAFCAKTTMTNLRITEINAFVPARDFELSKQFCLSDPCGVLWRIGQNTD